MTIIATIIAITVSTANDVDAVYDHDYHDIDEEDDDDNVMMTMMEMQ